MGNGSGTHGAGFHRDVEITVRQAVVADNVAGFTQGLHFGVRRGIVIADGTVAAASHDLAVAHDDCSNRHLAKRKGPLRFAQRFLHEEFVGAGHEGEG